MLQYLTICIILLQVWKFKTDSPIFSSPCIWPDRGNSAKSIVFGSHDNHVYSLDYSGTLQWKHELTSAVYSSPFLADIRTSANVFDGLVACSTDGTVSVLSLQTGKSLRSLKLPGDVFSSPIVFRGFIFVGCRNNFLYCMGNDRDCNEFENKEMND